MKTLIYIALLILFTFTALVDCSCGDKKCNRTDTFYPFADNEKLLYKEGDKLILKNDSGKRDTFTIHISKGTEFYPYDNKYCKNVGERPEWIIYDLKDTSNLSTDFSYSKKSPLSIPNPFQVKCWGDHFQKIENISTFNVNGITYTNVMLFYNENNAYLKKVKKVWTNLPYGILKVEQLDGSTWTYEKIISN